MRGRRDARVDGKRFYCCSCFSLEAFLKQFCRKSNSYSLVSVIRFFGIELGSSTDNGSTKHSLFRKFDRALDFEKRHIVAFNLPQKEEEDMR